MSYVLNSYLLTYLRTYLYTYLLTYLDVNGQRTDGRATRKHNVLRLPLLAEA